MIILMRQRIEKKKNKQKMRREIEHDARMMMLFWCVINLKRFSVGRRRRHRLYFVCTLANETARLSALRIKTLNVAFYGISGCIRDRV